VELRRAPGPVAALQLLAQPLVEEAGEEEDRTAGMLATIENLLGLSPMSIFDQRATRMWPSFGSANLQPYDLIEPTVIPYDDPGYPTNSANAPFAALSAAQDFSVPDGPHEHILNQAIWQSIRGAGSPMPAPVGMPDPDD